MVNRIQLAGHKLVQFRIKPLPYFLFSLNNQFLPSWDICGLGADPGPFIIGGMKELFIGGPIFVTGGPLGLASVYIGVGCKLLGPLNRF